MAKKHFSWENFSYDFIKGVVYGKETPLKNQPRTLYDESEYEHLIPYINRICIYPDEAFVRKYRNTIEDYFLNGTNYLVEVTRKLEKLNYGGIRVGNNDDMLFSLRSKHMTQTLCDAYLSVLRIAGKSVIDEEESLFKVPKTVALS